MVLPWARARHRPRPMVWAGGAAGGPGPQRRRAAGGAGGHMGRAPAEGWVPGAGAHVSAIGGGPGAAPGASGSAIGGG
eukprot:10281220-Alexandrium_andersonii.AAC.1